MKLKQGQNMGFVADKIREKKKRTFEEEKQHMLKLQKQWLKKNKIKKCPDAYLDNPYKQSAYSSQTSESSSGAN